MHSSLNGKISQEFEGRNKSSQLSKTLLRIQIQQCYVWVELIPLLIRSSNILFFKFLGIAPKAPCMVDIIVISL